MCFTTRHCDTYMYMYIHMYVHLHVHVCPSHCVIPHVQGEGATELTLEGVAGVGSEMERIHIAEKNKAMAAKLKVMRYIHVAESVAELAVKSQNAI